MSQTGMHDVKQRINTFFFLKKEKKTNKLLNENIKLNFCDLELGNGFLVTTKA